MWKYIAATVILFGLYALSTQKVQANEVVASDSFEDGYLQSQWMLTEGSEHTAKVQNGKFVFTITQPQYITQYYLDTTLPKNYRIEYEMTPYSGADKNIYTKFFDPQNWIQMHISGSNFYFVAVKNGEVLLLDSGVYEWTNGQTKQVVIQNNNGQLEIWLNNQEIATGTDPFADWYGGFFSLLVGTGAVYPTKVSFDNVVIYDLDFQSIDGHILNVERMTQTDGRWSGQEYDSASQWSNKTTIADWGCAMTSAVMIMRYHGISTMPDGSEVNPETVNTWMQNNHGYVGGLVSFASLTVLAREISDIYGTPKLEYQRHSADYDPIIGQINQDRPVVLEIPGHFVVGNGYKNNGDLRIVDPSYNRTLLSEHGTTLLSMRTLTPSYTDLRFIEILLPSGVTGYLQDSAGHPVPNSLSFESYIQTQDGEITTASLIEVPKLLEGEYRLVLTSPAAEGEVQLKSVDIGGNQDVLTAQIESEQLKILVHLGGSAVIETIATQQPTPTPQPSTAPEPVSEPAPTPQPPPSSTTPPNIIDIHSLLSPTIHAIASISAAHAGDAKPPTVGTTTQPALITQLPYCPAPQKTTSTQVVEGKTSPITINLNLGFGGWDQILALYSAFATTVMAKN